MGTNTYRQRLAEALGLIEANAGLHKPLIMPNKEAYKQAAEKLYSLTAKIAQRLNRPPEPLLKALQKVISTNSDRVEMWANQINTPEEMMVKFQDWQQRGIFRK